MQFLKYIIPFVLIASNNSIAKTYLDMFKGRVCLRCHDLKEPATGPSFEMISMKYENDPQAIERLTKVVLEGTIGNWTEEVPMPPIADYSEEEARELITWILTEAQTASPTDKSFPYEYPAGLAGVIALGSFAVIRRKNKRKNKTITL